MRAPVFFLADASPSTGSGHVLRCIWLAEVLREGGHTCTFLLREGADFAREKVRAADFEHIVLAESSLTDAGLLANPILAGSIPGPYPWLVIDDDRSAFYQPTFHRAIRERGIRLMMIVFRIEGAFDVDILHNQNPRALDHCYEVRPETELLLGLEYFIAAPAFREGRIGRQPPVSAVRRVFLNFGGRDVGGLTLRILGLLLAAFPALEYVVVVGGLYPGWEALQAFASQYPGVELYRNTNRMRELMAGCDLAVTAGGFTAWELGLLEVPNLVLPSSEREIRTAAKLDELGSIFFAGPAPQLSDDAFLDIFSRILQDPAERRERAGRMRDRINPQGVLAVAEKIRSFGANGN